jgi:Tol biopolymer transport system component
LAVAAAWWIPAVLTGGCRSEEAPGPPEAVEIAPPPGGSFYGLTPQFAVSPDGRQVAFVADAGGGAASLWVQDAGAATAPPQPLSGTDQATYPFWSADGRFVGYFASGKLMKVPVAGGEPAVVCDAPTGRGGTWNADDVIVFTSGITDPLRRVPASGGQPEAATTLDTPRESSHRWPQFLPDGRHILFWAGGGSEPAALKVASLDSRDVVPVVQADTNGAYAAGRVFFGRRSQLMAQPFDPATLRVSGEPALVAEPLSGDAGSSVASLAASASSGTLLYTRGEARGFVLTWFDESGARLERLGQPGQYTNVALSADGSRAAVSLTAGSPPNRDIWTLEVSDGAATRLTTEPSVDATPVWSADGRALVFSAPRGGPYRMYRRNFDSSTDELLLQSDVASIATDWSRDGRYVAYTRGTAASGMDVWILPLSGDPQPFPLAQGPGAEDSGTFSPDGRWVAYQSNESGRSEIYVRPLSPSAAAAAGVPVSRDGGTQPLWRADGSELYFMALDGSIMAATVHAVGAAFTAEPPRKLFSAPLSLVIRRSYDVTADGGRFLIPILDDSVRQTITVVRGQ